MLKPHMTFIFYIYMSCAQVHESFLVSESYSYILYIFIVHEHYERAGV